MRQRAIRLLNEHNRIILSYPVPVAELARAGWMRQIRQTVNRALAMARQIRSAAQPLCPLLRIHMQKRNRQRPCHLHGRRKCLPFPQIAALPEAQTLPSIRHPPLRFLNASKERMDMPPEVLPSRRSGQRSCRVMLLATNYQRLRRLRVLDVEEEGGESAHQVD